MTALTPRARTFTKIRGYWAFWQTLAICSLRASIDALATAPSSLTFERVLVGSYAVAIVLVIVYGFAWVPTGTLDPAFGLIAIRKLAATFGPGLFVTRYWRQATGWSSRALVLLTFIGAVGIVCWLNPEDRVGLALYNLLYGAFVLYLSLIWPRTIWRVLHVFGSRPR